MQVGHNKQGRIENSSGARQGGVRCLDGRGVHCVCPVGVAGGRRWSEVRLVPTKRIAWCSRIFDYQVAVTNRGERDDAEVESVEVGVRRLRAIPLVRRRDVYGNACREICRWTW